MVNPMTHVLMSVMKLATCLQNRSLFPDAQINIFVFGISDHVNVRGLECLTSLSITPYESHIFNFDDFDAFEEALQLVILTLKYSYHFDLY